MQADYTVTYQPGSPVQEYLVSEMVACRWRMQRLRLIETALIDSEMDRELPDVETPEDPGYQLAFAFRRLVDESRAISLASRYESRLHRIHEQSHRTLRELQNNPSVSAGIPEPVSSAPVQPEPSTAGPELVPTPATEADEKSPNEPTPPPPAAVKKDHQPISIVIHSSLESSKSWGRRSCRLPRSIAA